VPISITILEAFGLYLVRTSALILGSPLLGTGTGFAGYKIALIIGVAAVLFAAAGTPQPLDVAGFEYGMLCLREVLIGLFLAFVLQAVVLAVRVGGELIGTEMAFNMAAVVDPGTGIRTPLITQFYEALFFLGLLAVNGHHWVLRALSSSFERAPIGSLHFDDGAFAMIQDLFVHMFNAGIVFAAPVLLLLMLVSVVIGLMARVVPQVNVLEMGFTLRISVALVAMLVFSPLIAPAMDVLFENLMGGLEGALDVLGS
jgi:flagellar biosynthetic protein FliR